jgi:hypothetical protein
VGLAQRSHWVQAQEALLLADGVGQVIDNLASLPKPTIQSEQVLAYYRANAYRMLYHTYQSQGLCIGSGAIESAHRSVIQRRLKLAGQRWKRAGAQHVLNLRAAHMSQQWDKVLNLIQHPQPQMAA